MDETRKRSGSPGTDAAPEAAALRVLHFTPVWLPQTMTWLYNQARYLSQASVECHVVCHQTMNLEQFHLSHIHCRPAPDRLGRAAAAVWRRLGGSPDPARVVHVAGRVGARLLHSHFGTQGWRMLGPARRACLKHVVTFYGYDVNMLPTVQPAWKERYLRLFEQADLILCEGPHMADRLMELGCPKQKVQVQRLGVDLTRLPFRPRERSPDEPLRVLLAGTFREKKGIPWALDAVDRAVKRGAKLRVTLYGDATKEPRDIEEKARILELIRCHGMEDRVAMPGFVPHEQLIAAFYDHHLFLSPSVAAANGDTEGGAPVTLIEAAASGLPVVSTRHCDIPFVLGGEAGGFYAPERDAVVLADHLERLYAQPDAGRGRARAARRHIEADHDAAAQGRRLGRRYRALVSA